MIRHTARPLRRGVPLSWVMVFLAVTGTSYVLAEELPPLDCVISPYEVVDLASSVRGVLDKIYVDKSDFIEKGAVAASLEAGVERASVQLATARAAIDSEVQVGVVNLDFDQRRKARIQSLYDKKTVSIELKDEADRARALSRWRLQQAKDLKGIRQLELVRAQEQLKQKIIRTPISGFVLQRFKVAGEYVEDQPIMRIAQLDPLYVEAVVPIEFYGRIASGMHARVYPEPAGDKSYDAEVAVIDRAGDAASGTFGIRLALPNPEHKVLAGVRCVLKFN